MDEEQLKQALAEKEAALAKVTEEARLAKEALDKVGEKDHNFEALRKAKEETEKKLQETISAHEQEKKERAEAEQKKKAEEIQGYKTNILQVLSKGDKETLDKLQAKFKELGGEQTDDYEKIKTLATYAFQLATENKVEPNILAGVISSASGGPVNQGKQEILNPELRALGYKLGLSDADYQKARDKGVI